MVSPAGAKQRRKVPGPQVQVTFAASGPLGISWRYVAGGG
eukprot:SAG31_NODE_1512_length_8055_cov_3.286199_7_plen_40_part_00